MAHLEAIAPGATIGILGGGQLGRMLCLAAAQLGYRTHIYCPEPASPASLVASQTTVAGYDDQVALGSFAAAVNVVTFEFENIPAETVEFVQQSVCVSPSTGTLRVTQDRLAEKQLCQSLGIPTAPFAAVSSAADFAVAAEATEMIARAYFVYLASRNCSMLTAAVCRLVAGVYVCVCVKNYC